MNITKKPTMLMILDGFGANSEKYGNAIDSALTPSLDLIMKKYPHTNIKCCGLDVGLPDGQMGNSEVGHLNIGAGRVIYQDLTAISKAIEEKTFFQNQALIKAMDHCISNNTPLHIMGLISDGGVHSHISHVKALLQMAKVKGVSSVYLHGFLDGRDVPPNSAIPFVEEVEEYMAEIGLGAFGSIAGRYYAMDRDKRWDRVEKAYDAMTLGQGLTAKTPVEAIQASYERDQADEFVLPTVIEPFVPIDNNHGIIMFNFRPDRAREITRAFVDKDFVGFERKKVIQNLFFTCMTMYDKEIQGVEVAFPPEHYQGTLGEHISSLGLKQLRIAETEKYAHVTFFFNGGVEEPNENEDRILIPSPKVATYDLQPEMSAPLVAEKVIECIKEDKYDLIVLNFANADMVGHTGIFSAAVKAIETLDGLVMEIVDQVLSQGGQILLTADHGNADKMLDKTGAVITAHSLNPVPLVNISSDPAPLADGGKLADIAPTLLDMMGLPIPDEMTGKSLLLK